MIRQHLRSCLGNWSSSAFMERGAVSRLFPPWIAHDFSIAAPGSGGSGRTPINHRSPSKAVFGATRFISQGYIQRLLDPLLGAATLRSCQTKACLGPQEPAGGPGEYRHHAAFVRLREILATNRELAAKVEEMERRYDAHFKAILEVIQALMAQPEESVRGRLVLPPARK